MRTGSVFFVLGCLALVQPAHAQEPKQDSTTLRRARRPLVRVGEVVGVVVTTGVAVALDKSLRNTIHDPTDSFGRTASDIGNALGSAFVYPTLLGIAVGGKVIHHNGIYGVSSRALKSTLLGGAAGLILKSMIGRERPTISPDNQFKFHPFTFKDNSFPSGHTTIAFALATSFARETHNKIFDVLFFSMATLTAYARMHDDRHWASDVVFGAGVGILSARFVHRFQAKLAVAPGALGMSLEF